MMTEKTSETEYEWIVLPSRPELTAHVCGESIHLVQVGPAGTNQIVIGLHDLEYFASEMHEITLMLDDERKGV
jgi:hypothetical protein